MPLYSAQSARKGERDADPDQAFSDVLGPAGLPFAEFSGKFWDLLAEIKVKHI